MKKDKSIKQMIAEKEEARIEKQVAVMNGKYPDGRKVKLTAEQKAEKKKAYQREWWAKKKAQMRQEAAEEFKKVNAELDSIEEELKARRKDIERELTDKALLDQSAKSDAGKPQLSLVPMDILTAIARVREYGNRKYGDPNNWKTVSKARYVDAMLRHAVAFVNDPKGVDSESGLPHLHHLACNVAFLIAMEKM